MSQKQQLCLIHGHGVDASIWDGVYADLVSEALVSRPDFANRTDLATIEAYADTLYQYLQANSSGLVTLVGHSMGGYIALAFAEKYPTFIKGLVLYHSTAKADDEIRRQARAQAIQGLKEQGTPAFIQRQMPKMVSPDYPTEQTQLLIERFQSLPTEALIVGMSAMAARPDRTTVLQQATYPVLLVLGRQDQIILYEQALHLAQLSDRIHVATIEQAGHLSMIEQPQQSVQVLRTFLEAL